MRALVVDPDRLQIGEPTPARLIHRVTDIISSHRPLAADFATLSHTNENSSITQGNLQAGRAWAGYATAEPVALALRADLVLLATKRRL